MTFFLRFRIWLIAGLVALLSVSFVVRVPTAKYIGSGIQTFLPLIAAICSAGNGTILETVSRYALLEMAVQGSKLGLGASTMNQRPNGGDGGFPSGHAARASFGAAAALRECAFVLPAARTVLVLSAGFTATSRVSEEKHSIWQVVFGVLYGIFGDALFRRNWRRRKHVHID